MTAAVKKPAGPTPSRELLLAELLLSLFLVVVADLSDPARLLAWLFGPLPDLPWSDFFPWLSLIEGIRNILLAAAVGCLFFRVRFAEHVRTALAVYLVLVICVLPVLGQIELRHNVDEAPGNTALYRSTSADGGVCQVEMASAAVLRGENPYGMDYNRPPASRSQDSDPAGWRGLGYEENPALEHLTYPPGVLYVTVPFDWLSRQTLGFFDVRFVYLLAAFALAFVLASLVPPGPPRRMAVVATLASPLLAPYLAAGRNDVLVLLALAIFARLLLRRRWAGAAVALGAAMCMKQFALLAVPFFLITLYRDRDGDLRRSARSAWPLVAVPLVVSAPFLVWDPGALIEDVLLWTQGSGYPVRWDGYGLSNLAYGLGVVEDPSGPNPYGVVGLVILIGGLVGLSFWTWRKPSPWRVLVASGALLYVALFGARSFTESYLAVPVLLWVAAGLGRISSLLPPPRAEEE